MSGQKRYDEQMSPSHRAGCSPWALLGCGCGLLAMIGIALVFLTLGANYAAARRTPAVDVRAYGQCQIHLRSLGRAIASYAKDHGAPPAKLDDLYPRYLLDQASLHCPLEVHGGVRYRYTPRTNPDPTTAVISCTNHKQGMLALQADGRVRLPER